jgi:hypothetical protein
MQAFFVRWRSARQHREFEVFAQTEIGTVLFSALKASGGWEVWEAGTVWRCPGCYDSTLRTEEFLEGLRRAENYLSGVMQEALDPNHEACYREALAWLKQMCLKMLGCERDRVYIKDATNPCRFAGETYISRV